MFLWIFCTGVQRVIFHDDHRRGVPAPAESHRTGTQHTLLRKWDRGEGNRMHTILLTWLNPVPERR